MGETLTRDKTEVLALLHGSNGPKSAHEPLRPMQRCGGTVAPPAVVYFNTIETDQQVQAVA